MKLLTTSIRDQLLRNGFLRRALTEDGGAEPDFLPVVKLFTLPIIFLTLGLFALVVNGLMLMLTGWLAGRLGLEFQVAGCWPAILGAIVVSIVSTLLSMLLAEPD